MGGRKRHNKGLLMSYLLSKLRALQKKAPRRAVELSPLLFSDVIKQLEYLEFKARKENNVRTSDKGSDASTE